MTKHAHRPVLIFSVAVSLCHPPRPEWLAALGLDSLILLLSALSTLPATRLLPAVLILYFHTVLFQQAHALPACRNRQILASVKMHLLQSPVCESRFAMQKTGNPVCLVLRQLFGSRLALLENQSRVRPNHTVKASTGNRLASTCPYQTVAGAEPFQMQFCATCTWVFVCKAFSKLPLLLCCSCV